MLRITASQFATTSSRGNSVKFLLKKASSSSAPSIRSSSCVHHFQYSDTSFFSTKATSSGNDGTTTTKCPFSGASGSAGGKLNNQKTRDLHSSGSAQKAQDAAAALDGGMMENNNAPRVPLRELPALPVFGSFFAAVPIVGGMLAEMYDIPTLNKTNAYEYYPSMREKYGDFYAVTIPGLGKVHTLNDPKEMMKVLRQEGAYPKGGIENLKAFVKWGQSRNVSLVSGEDGGFFGRGETWRTTRTFLQTDLLSPQSARGYVPGVVKAAEIASRGAPHFVDNMNRYINYCAFDMFNTIMFGELSKVSDPTVPTDPINEEFVTNSITSLALLINQIMDAQEIIKANMGIETQMYKDYVAAQDVVNRIGTEKVIAFREKWQNGDLDEFQKDSYIAHAFGRQKQQEQESKNNGEINTITTDQMTEITMFLLNAGVDTTSTFISWALVHLSLNPEIQDKLHMEVKENLSESKQSSLSAEVLTRSKAPYLNAVLRESHRMTPVHPTVLNKSNPNKEIEIHGNIIPQGSNFSFDSYSMGIDPTIVSNPNEFIPERWFPDAVNERKGTPAEILDHQFYKDPFSQGARRCPGSRVAVNETLVLLSQLVLDWKFEFAPESNIKSLQDIPYEQQTLLVPQLPKMIVTPRA